MGKRKERIDVIEHFIIGTAGHIDHGKTSLIERLTGRNTDRLKEEKERGISIELGFTYFDLGEGQKVGIIDVPGHEKFIKQMLSGAVGMDMVMLVIAADEGVMPQTKEHIDIMSYLNIQKGIIVLSKVDMVEKDWLELVEEDIRKELRDTFMADAPILRISAKTGEGIEALKQKIALYAKEMNQRDVQALPRLAVDRAFTLQGFGTVVTGTLISGSIAVGDSLQVYPKNLVAKVRSLQVHGESKETAYAGQRVALNLGGIKKEEVERGDVLSWKDKLQSTERVDVYLSVLKTGERSIEDNTKYHFYTGTDEALCRIKLLEKSILLPGESGYAQLIMDKKIVTYAQDPFVLRFYSPMITTGGGVILDVAPKRHRQKEKGVLSWLRVLKENKPEEIFLYFLKKATFPYQTIEEISNGLGFSENQVLELIGKNPSLIRKQTIQKVDYYAHKEGVSGAEQGVLAFLKGYHKAFPYRLGIPLEEMKSKIFPGIKPTLSNFLIQQMKEEKQIKIGHDKVSVQDFEIIFDKKLDNLSKTIEAFFINDKISMYKSGEIEKNFTTTEIEPVMEWMLSTGRLVKVGEEFFMHRQSLAQAQALLQDYMKVHGQITLAEFRDLSLLSRKQAEVLLERFDRERITMRREDYRILVNSGIGE